MARISLRDAQVFFRDATPVTPEEIEIKIEYIGEMLLRGDSVVFTLPSSVCCPETYDPNRSENIERGTWRRQEVNLLVFFCSG